MKKITLIFSIIIAIYTSAQEKASLEKSVTGIQIGFFGVEIYNEAKLSDAVSLRSQLALYSSIWGGDLYSKTGFALAPALSVTPKYYYNLQKRKDKGRNISNNSGNYISAKLEYVPNWFVISNVPGIGVNDMISFIPTWGLRRNIATNFNYEFKAGLGIGKILQKGYDTQVVPELSFKIGYDF
ncbi:hypothetical protein QGN23_12005 [Chryseobacterium gotjawalense]|uniref:DUF3575 domain-containing protein n=1 Tax=Chryseobacterium gotjawalense TaxID=3042315 RepID=A0ABY8RD52_9FLAO|nr:hypothetical protein [Chryseobacterium sp. wdc7]WHF51147.1 hypothetical protein QGN23_12005 [Chryseobacterium sp. wdc7]